MDDLQIDIDAEAVFLDGGWYTREDLTRRIKAMLDSGDFNVARPSAALEALTQTVKSLRTLSFRCTPDIESALNDIAGRTGSSVGGVVREAVIQFLQETGNSAAGRGSPPSTGSGSHQAAARPPAPPALSAAPASMPQAAPAAPPAPVGYAAPQTPAAQPVPPQLAPAAPPGGTSVSFNSLPLVVDVDEGVEEPRQQEPTVRRAFPTPPTGTTQDDLPKVIVDEQPMVIAGPGALANAGVTQRPIELTQKKSGEHKPDEAVSSEHRWFKQ
ncbi:MAG: hypothetical protein AB1730_07880 [Myxococcota bacterium]|jgi:hypothetical protein